MLIGQAVGDGVRTIGRNRIGRLIVDLLATVDDRAERQRTEAGCLGQAQRVSSEPLATVPITAVWRCPSVCVWDGVSRSATVHPSAPMTVKSLEERTLRTPESL